MVEERIIALIIKEIMGELTPEDQLELEHWRGMSTENQLVYEQILSEENIQDAPIDFEMSERTKAPAMRRFRELRQAYRAANSEPPGRVRFFGRPYIRLVAATVIFLILSIGTWLFWNEKSHHAMRVAEANDIAPGGSRAILTLADGRQIVLQQARKGNIAVQGRSQIQKADSNLVTYNSGIHNQPLALTPGGKPEEMQYNAIQTPRAGTFQVVLPDGTKVWLNAASSLRFPVSFDGNSRTVSLVGEGYFEVAKDRNRPFIVQVGRSQVKVLGTSFNINAYRDEPTLNTTLYEGAVQVSGASGDRVLTPGQTAKIDTTTGGLQIVNEPDPTKEIAWKDHNFQFDNDSITYVMRQIARWYDVEIEYQAYPTKTFYGEISMDNNVSDVLSALKASKGVNFRVEGKKIFVLP